MARALLLVALAAGAAALPQRLRASAAPAKKAAHDHPRRAAPSLAALDASLGDLAGTLEKEAHGAAHAGGVSRALGALEADLDHLLEHSVLEFERRFEVLAAIGLETAVEALIDFVVEKGLNAVGDRVRKIFDSGGKDGQTMVEPVEAAEKNLMHACVQLKAHVVSAKALSE